MKEKSTTTESASTVCYEMIEAKARKRFKDGGLPMHAMEERGGAGFSVSRRRLLAYAASSPVMTIAAGVGANLATPSSAVAQTTILWSADMESGYLLESNGGEWDEEVVTDSADSSAQLASSMGIPPYSGSYVMKQSVLGSVGGTRMGSYNEITTRVQAGGDFWVSWFDYYPNRITFNNTNDMWNFWQIAGQAQDLSYNPVWTLNVDGSTFYPWLFWPANGAYLAGPHQGESGPKDYKCTTPIPVGSWVRFDIYVKPSRNFTGALTIYMNGTTLFDLSAINTSYPTVPPGVGNPGESGFFYMTHNAYGSNLTPTPATHYVDKVTYSTARMP